MRTPSSNFAYRLFLIVDLPTFAMIESLVMRLEAHSIGDIIRQAVRAFALSFALSRKMDVQNLSDGDDGPSQSLGMKRLNVRIPLQTKERLDYLRDNSGMSYTDIITIGLHLLDDRAADEECILSTLKEGGKMETCPQREVTSDVRRKYRVVPRKTGT